MEYLENGDLHHYLQKSPPFSADVAGETTFQILEGLLFMHENHFAHRDLKPAVCFLQYSISWAKRLSLIAYQNILLRSKPPDIWIKIGDFGLSKRVEDELGLTNTLKGTMGFIAPELHGFTSRETDYAPDIWALGEIAFQMLTKKPTFRNLGLLARYVHDAKLFPEDDLHEQQVHDQVIDFVRSTMCALPADRFTAQQGLEHPWILSFAPESPTPELPETERRVSLESVVEDLGAWTAFSAAISEHSLQAIKAVAARSTPKTPASSSSSFQQGTVVPRKKVPEMPRMLSSPSAPSTSRSADYFSIHDARAKIDRILVPQDVNLGIFDRAHLETPGTVTTAATSPSPLVSTDAFDKGRILQSLDPALRAKLLSMGMSDDQLADNADFIHTYLLAQEKEQSNGTQDSIPSSSLLPSLGQRTREVQGVAKRQKAKPPALTGMSGVPSKHSQLPTRDQHPVPFQDHATPAASGRQVIYKPAGSRPILQYHVDERVKGKHRGKNTEPPSRYRQEDAATRTVEVHGLANFTTEQDVRTFCRSAGKVCCAAISFCLFNTWYCLYRRVLFPDQVWHESMYRDCPL
jgi:serine/threonine protein kinase